MSHNINKHFYKNFEFYAGIFLTLIWLVSFIHSSSIIDTIINALFLIYGIYCVIHALLGKR